MAFCHNSRPEVLQRGDKIITEPLGENNGFYHPSLLVLLCLEAWQNVLTKATLRGDSSAELQSAS